MRISDYIRSRSLFLLAFFVMFTFLFVYGVITGLNQNYFYLLFIIALGIVITIIMDVVRSCREAKKLKIIADTNDTSSLLSMPETTDPYRLIYQEIIANTYAQSETQTELLNQKIDHDADYYTTWIHQIKTPITASRLIIDTNRTLENERTFLQLEQEIDKIEQYATMALYYSRLNDFHQDYSIEQVSLDALIRSVTKRLANIFIYKSISISLKESNTYVYSDKKWLAFIIEQITTNALKYTAKNGNISFIIENKRDETILSIRDTGIGIASEDLPRVFQRSFTGSAGRKVQNTSGIGLYMCSTLAQKLAHRLTIESELGVGTTVSIHFAQHDNTLFD